MKNNMHLCVAGVGVVATSTIRIKDKDNKATFTLRSHDDRYYVVTAGLEQLRTIANLNGDTRILLMGSLYSFRGKCGQHHVAVEPQILIPLDGLEAGQSAILQAIMSQWTNNVLARQTGES